MHISTGIGYHFNFTYKDAFNGAQYKDRLNPEAKLDLSTLLTGLTTMEFNLPILNPTSHQTKECMVFIIDI